MFRTGPMPERLLQSSTVAPRSCDPRRQRCGNSVVIAERQNAVSDDLSGLMTFASDQQHIARLQRADRGSDRLGAVGNLPAAVRGFQDCGADSCRIFATRIVISDNNPVSIFGG